jgi:SEC-C motif
VAVLSINFGGRKELPRGRARETKRHAWPVAGPRAYPWILAVAVDGLSRPVTERDYAYATALLEALAVFLREHAVVFEEEPAIPITRTVVLDGLPDAPSVTLSAPHPDMYWDWLDGDPVRAARWDEAGDLADRFVADQVRHGRSGEWLRSAQALVEDLCRFKIDTADEASVGWTAKQVEEYLLDYFPSLAVVPPEDVERVPEQLEAFFGWLADEGYESLPTVRDIRARITRKRSAFLERARHPAPASPRSLGLEIRKSGIDASDEAALADFISKWSADVEATSATPPARTSKRWRWTPASPAPDPAAPCPCGSGIRYRKCCMPR